MEYRLHVVRWEITMIKLIDHYPCMLYAVCDVHLGCQKIYFDWHFNNTQKIMVHTSTAFYV